MKSPKELVIPVSQDTKKKIDPKTIIPPSSKLIKPSVQTTPSADSLEGGKSGASSDIQITNKALPAQTPLSWYEFGFPVIPIIPGSKRTAEKWDPWLDGLSPLMTLIH